MAIVAASAAAADDAPSPAASQPVSQPATKPAPLSSPRATIQQFLLAVEEAKTRPERISDAVACLDLSSIPADERGDQGPKRAAALATILEGSAIPPLETVPKEAEKDEYAYVTVAEHTIGLDRGSDGLWRFSADTVKNIPIILQGLSKAAATQEAPVADVRVPEAFRSARATMGTFLKAVNEADFDTAIRCLDLSEIDQAVRREVGQQRARRLKGIIDRVREVIQANIPDDPLGERYPWEVHPRFGRIELDRLPAEHERAGHWVFTKETVASVDEWYKAVEDTEKVVEGLSELSFWESPAGWLRQRIPSNLKGTGFLIERWQWIGVVIILIVGVVIHRVVSWFLENYVHRWLARQHVRVDREIQAASLRPFGIFVMVWFWWGGIRLLDFDLEVQRYLTPGIKFVVIAIGIWAFYRLVDLLMGYFESLAGRTESRIDDLIVPLLRKTFKVVIAVVGVLLLASAYAQDKNINRLLAGLGLGGLAFALAAQDTIKNIFGSITIILDRPFQVGDWVVVRDVEGTVEAVGFRSTKIRTFYNSVISVPNSELMNSTIDNYGQRRYRRIKRMLSVTYSTDPERLEAFCEGIRELILRHPYTRKDYFQVYVNVLEASSIDILLYCFLETPDWSTELRERHRLFLDIVRLARSLGVEFAFPTQTIHLDKGDGTVRPAGAPGDGEQARAEGRKHAERIVTSTVGPGGEKPSAVKVPQPPVEWRG